MHPGHLKVGIIMWKLLIVDDEPLVVTGLKTMLQWSDYDIDVCALAYNGQEALNLIQQHHPDIVIADIKMPVMTGIELMAACREQFGAHPVFILLSSYEDFSYAKEAIHYDAVEYLLKMELTQKILVDALYAAIEKLKSLHYAPTSGIDFHEIYDKFFVRLLYHLFETPEQYYAQKELLNLDLNCTAYICTYCRIILPENIPTSKVLTLCQSVLSMSRELLSHYCTTYTISLDLERFAVIFCLNDEQSQNVHSFIQDTLNKVIDTLKSYFNLQVITSTGLAYKLPTNISLSFTEAKNGIFLSSPEHPIFMCSQENEHSYLKPQKLKDIQESFSKALTEYDPLLLNESFENFHQFFNTPESSFILLLDTASNFLFMTISLLPDGEKIIAHIFNDTPEGYQSLYQFTQQEQLTEWLRTFQKGLTRIFYNKKRDHKKNTVFEIQKYIQNNLNKKLSLNDVANTFGLSPNYLSSIFKKTCSCTFTEYINQCKIQEAQKMLAKNQLKIYEISHQLGYDDAFYFSKVFKKIVGCSPREYVQNFSEK